MPAGRNWKEFNDAWRDRDGERILDAAFAALGSLISAAERIIKRLEPLGILLAVSALFLSLASFWIDYENKIQERTVQAWQLLTTKAPGNSGKVEAIEYLTSSDGLWCSNNGCRWPLKKPSILAGIDLSTSKDKVGAWLVDLELEEANLVGANFSRAILFRAKLINVNLNESNLTDANLGFANLTRTGLAEADLSRANLSSAYLGGAGLGGAKLIGANLHNANLAGADLFEADLSTAYLGSANLSGAWLGRTNLSGARLFNANLAGANLLQVNLSSADLAGSQRLTQDQLNSSCGNSETKLPDDLEISMCSEVDWYEDGHGYR